MPASDAASSIARLSLRYGYLALLIYLLANLGGADPYSTHIAGLMLSAMTATALLLPRHDPSVERLWLAVAVILAALVAMALLQSLRWAGHPAGHPAWQEAVIANADLPAVSVSPAQTRNSLLALAPCLGFLVILRMTPGPVEALAMLHRLALVGGGVAVFGLASHTLLPIGAASGAAGSYGDSLTATFVNPNSAGTFLGLGVLVSLALCLHSLRMPRLRATIPASIFAGLAFVQLLALLLTQSRGAIAATLAALLLLVALMGRELPARWRSAVSSTFNAKMAWFGTVTLGLGLLMFLFGGRVLQRLVQHGLDDTRLCAFGRMGKAFFDNLPFGAGFGTFQDTFPAYRDDACTGIAGVWEAAHNSFIEGGIGLGVVFLVAAPVAIALLARAFIAGLHRLHRLRLAPALGLAALTLICLHSLVDFSLQIPAVAFYAAAILGCCAAALLDHTDT